MTRETGGLVALTIATFMTVGALVGEGECHGTDERWEGRHAHVALLVMVVARALLIVTHYGCDYNL